MLRQNHSNAVAMRQPREFPATGFERIDSCQLVEEEKLPFYRRQDYYPMRIGQVVQESYQVVAKLGYGMSLRTLQELQKDGVFQQTLVTTALDQTLLGLNYLHDASVIHTDIHSDNLLIAITDDSVLVTVEDNELHRPSARKYVDDTVIHISQYMLGGAGALTICDLGQARIGKVHRSNAMPVPYRAPEVILGMTWGNAVDIWSVGLLAWDLLQQEGIFRVYDQSEELNDAHHLAAMTALLGPPPDIFLRRSEKTSKYWNAEGER
ncbi:hypothetical protein N0V84_009323 [Fusarium piperis]|uniref:Protein kinase domain-containing protein n=1 Tax=Fusarium piperis TaxID=1435070 RepID=A0A9W9BKS3_9HYPO|nr:hypothetical protein N0V84_009323 [Fusarium piperis]